MSNPECEEHDQDQAEKVAAQHCSACSEEELAWQRTRIADLEKWNSELEDEKAILLAQQSILFGNQIPLGEEKSEPPTVDKREGGEDRRRLGEGR